MHEQCVQTNKHNLEPLEHYIDNHTKTGDPNPHTKSINVL